MQAAIITHPVVASPIRHPRLDEIRHFPRPRYKGHWALASRNAEESHRFYDTLTITETICKPAPFSIAVSWDLEHHRFFILDLNSAGNDPSTGKPIESHGGSPQERTGVGLAALRFAAPGILVHVYEKMKQAGWEPLRVIDRGMTISLIYRDPDGLLVEALAANPDAPARPEADMAMEDFLARFG